MNTKRSRGIGSMLLGAGLLLATLSLPRAARAEEGDIAVGGEYLFTIRAAANGKSIRERADTVTDRLVPILSDQQLKPADVIVVSDSKSQAHINVAGHLLVTVLTEDGAANHAKVLALANQWASQLRKVLPKVNAKTNPDFKKGE